MTAIVCPSSSEKKEVKDAKARDVAIKLLDLDTASHDDLTSALLGQDVVISCLAHLNDSSSEARLADAAKAAGVKRFLPSFFATVTPPKGVLLVRETKEEVLSHIKKIHLPYTIVDVGLWYQGTFPQLPPGKVDYATAFFMNTTFEDGNLPTAMIDLRDVGKYVARIIVDHRTLNRSVFVHNELVTQDQVFTRLEAASGETIPRNYVSRVSHDEKLNKLKEAFEKDPSVANTFPLVMAQYLDTIWLRGDNLPKTAAYLGYLDGKELYPNVQTRNHADFIEELVAGKARAMYADRYKDMDLGNK